MCVCVCVDVCVTRGCIVAACCCHCTSVCDCLMIFDLYVTVVFYPFEMKAVRKLFRVSLQFVFFSKCRSEKMNTRTLF